MEEKTPLSHEVVCLQMLDFGTSKSNSEVSKSNLWKITSFSKTMLLLFAHPIFVVSAYPIFEVGLGKTCHNLCQFVWKRKVTRQYSEFGNR